MRIAIDVLLSLWLNHRNSPALRRSVANWSSNPEEKRERQRGVSLVVNGPSADFRRFVSTIDPIDAEVFSRPSRLSSLGDTIRHREWNDRCRPVSFEWMIFCSRKKKTGCKVRRVEKQYRTGAWSIQAIHRPFLRLFVEVSNASQSITKSMNTSAFVH